MYKRNFGSKPIYKDINFLFPPPTFKIRDLEEKNDTPYPAFQVFLIKASMNDT